ncbi:MAG: metallopeptidase family protein [Anaerolineae bacterium]
MDWMDASEFAEIVMEVLEDLPDEFRQRMENVEIEIRDWPGREEREQAGVPPGQTLFGLYQGIPLTERGHGYNLVLPDRIILFRGPIMRAGGTRAGVRRQIRRTLLHEIAHHFGISDDRLRELDAY